jgi:hypothetical protein
LAARGAQVEAGTPEFEFRLADKIEVWGDDAPRIYAQAVAAQWDPVWSKYSSANKIKNQ